MNKLDLLELAAYYKSYTAAAESVLVQIAEHLGISKTQAVKQLTKPASPKKGTNGKEQSTKAVKRKQVKAKTRTTVRKH